MDNYNYPLGSDTSDAPWNEQPSEELDTDVYVTVTLSKSTSITVSDYTNDGNMYDFNNSDLNDCYSSQEYSIITLLDELKARLKKDIKNNEDILKSLTSFPPASKNILMKEIKVWKKLLKAAEDWTIEELEVTPK